MSSGQSDDDRAGRVSFKVSLRAPDDAGPYVDKTPAPEAPAEPELVPGFSQAGYSFVTRLQLLSNYLRQIGEAAIGTSSTHVAGWIALARELVETKGDGRTALARLDLRMRFETAGEVDDEFVMSFPIYEAAHLKAVRSRTQYQGAALRILNETAIQHLANSYERLLGDIVRRHVFDNAADALVSESLTYKQILQFSSLDEVKRHVVERQVLSYIRNNDANDQIKKLQEYAGVDVSALYGGVTAYRELVLKRHAVVHAGGVVTSEYIRQLKQLGATGGIPKEGAILELTTEYIASSWDLVYSLGVVTLHSVWRAAAMHARDKQSEEAADSWLNAAAYWAIDNERFGAADRILKYANSLRLSTDTLQQMVLVNYAQTLKWLGRDPECQKLLSSKDWDAANTSFQLCAATLRNQDVTQLLCQAARDRAISLDDFCSWPVFKELRAGANYEAYLTAAFGADAKLPRELFPAELLDFAHKATYERIMQYLKTLNEHRKERRDVSVGATADSSNEDPTLH